MSATPTPKQSLAERFKALPTGARTAVIGAGVVTVLFALGTAFTDSGPGLQRGPGGPQRDAVTVFNPGNANATEALAANLEAARKQITDQQSKISLLEESVTQAQKQNNGADGQWSEIGNLAAQVLALQERVNGMGANGGESASGGPAAAGRVALAKPTGAPDLSKPLPGADLGSPAAAVQAPAAAAPALVPTIQIVGAERKAAPKADDAQKDKPAAYVPSGSNFEAVLLNGMDASTSIGANRSPTPALLRVKTDAILPNLFSFDVRECFILVGGFGNMSSERVEMRTETMSCIAQSGEVYEGKIEGYLVGEDGKAGARGRVVSKQGALLAKSFMAGFVGGLGGAFTPQPVQSLSLSGGTTQQYQLPSAEQVLGSGLATGLNRSSQALANFYIKLAEQMFPVVELDAGRKMTIILLKGVALKMDKKA